MSDIRPIPDTRYTMHRDGRVWGPSGLLLTLSARKYYKLHGKRYYAADLYSSVWGCKAPQHLHRVTVKRSERASFCMTDIPPDAAEAAGDWLGLDVVYVGHPGHPVDAQIIGKRGDCWYIRLSEPLKVTGNVGGAALPLGRETVALVRAEYLAVRDTCAAG